MRFTLSKFGVWKYFIQTRARLCDRQIWKNEAHILQFTTKKAGTGIRALFCLIMLTFFIFGGSCISPLKEWKLVKINGLKKDGSSKCLQLSMFNYCFDRPLVYLREILYKGKNQIAWKQLRRPEGRQLSNLWKVGWMVLLSVEYAYIA